jgi:penicillin amidase
MSYKINSTLHRPTRFRILKSVFLTLLLTGLVIFLNSGWGKIPALGPMLSPFTGVWAHTPGEKILLERYHLNRHLTSPVTIQQERNGLFHIFAANDEDLYAAQGYTVSSQRLFQMNFLARAAEGRLAEWVGPAALTTDKFFQQMDLAKAARESADLMMQDRFTAMALEQYAAGVNAYVDSLGPGELPIEFKLLGAEPDQWSPYRSALLLKIMTYLLTGSSRDVPLTRSVQKAMDLADLDTLFPLYEKNVIPSISSSEFPILRPKSQRVYLKPSIGTSNSGTSSIPLHPNPNNGSNNWAVSGAKTRSGYPLLAGDMHLSYQLPAQWIALQLKSHHQDVIGFSLPGAPGIVMGANRNLAWAVTNGGADVLDWHRIVWASKVEGTGLSSGKENQYYQVGKNTRKAQIENRSIKVRGALSVPVSVIWTHLGPVLEMESDVGDKEFLAAHWLGHSASREITAFLELNRADSVENCFKILERSFATPQQNFLCVDHQNIGLMVAGQVPLRSPGEGRIILPATDEPSWTEFVPTQHLPRSLNPRSGYLFSANQQIYDEQYPYYFQWHYRPSFRAERIKRLLESQSVFSPEDFASFQKDDYLIPAERSLPRLLSIMDSHLENLESSQKAYINKLKEWDYRAEQDQSYPTFFHLWWKHIDQLMWQQFWPDPKNYQWPTFEVTLDLLMRDQITFQNETKPSEPLILDSRSIIREAFARAWREFNAAPESQQWGEANKAQFQHLLRLPHWSRTATDSGARDAINAQDAVHGASARLVVSMSYPPRVWGHHPGGPSGDPLSEQYDSWMKHWTSNRLMEWNFAPSPIAHSSELLLSRVFEGSKP